MNYTIVFKAQGKPDVKLTAEPGTNLLELAQGAGIPVDAPCGGSGTCGKCRARLISGTVDATRNIHLSDEDFEDGWRLICQCKVAADATLWLPSSSSTFESGIQTADLSTPEELARYKSEIDNIFNTGIARGREGCDLGVAVDIGTTTVSGALLNIDTGDVLGKASKGNAQIRYGADVINRIINQTKPGGVEKLQHAVREETLIPIIDQLCEQGGIEPSQIKCCSIAGNTTMEHLFVGANGDSIRLEPFVPEFLELTGKTASDLGLPFDPDSPVILAPNVGSYVGGDITAGVLASRLWNSSEMTLFIDLGTNGEIVFGNSDFMLCCACSAGPAFEGGDISCGMRATNGAVDACTINEETMTPTFSVIGDEKPAGLCGSGLIDVIAELFRCGIINSKGRFARDGERIIRSDVSAEYILAFADESASGQMLTINETDIDNFVRAKGAIFSAIRSMLSSLDMPVEILDRVIIAGGIGSGINIHNAISIGMLPKIPEEKYAYIGNSSLTGSCAILLSSAAEEKVFELARNMTYIELSTHPGYMDEFVAACFIPHTDASLFN